VSADQGVSVSLGRIDVAQRLSPGGHYHLPGVTVTNIGDQAQQYEVVVNYLDDAGRDRPPGGWFGITAKNLALVEGNPAGHRPANWRKPGSYLASSRRTRSSTMARGSPRGGNARLILEAGHTA
jgi:hypothetical protein